MASSPEDIPESEPHQIDPTGQVPDPSEKALDDDLEPVTRAIETIDTTPQGDSPSDLPEGKTVGPYEILSVLGKGGMGVVYKAFHPALKRKVALKVLIAGEDASDEALTRFAREAQSVARLGHHPNIVPVYDTGSVSGRGADGKGTVQYIAMHLVNGFSLDRLIDEKHLPPVEAARIASDIASALIHAHGHGIIHRDVKPANVLISTYDSAEEPQSEADQPCRKGPGIPMLTDFGLARDVGSSARVTRSGAALGTPHYMPPEQAGGRLEQIDERSDVYSLGATLYEMLTLRTPFEGSGVIEVLNKVVREEPRPVRKVNPGVHPDLETICLKCLEKNPARRYQSAEELRDDIERFLEGRPVVARPVSSLGRLWKKVLRNPLLAAVSAAFVVIIAAAAVALVVAKQNVDRSRGARELAERESTIESGLRSKSERLSTVLLAGFARLGTLQARLKTASKEPAIDGDGLRRIMESEAELIDSFDKSVPSDGASQATWLAMRGWLSALAGMEEESAGCFERARLADPEVPWGYLFEALALLRKYFLDLPVPMLRIGPAGATFGSIPPASPDLPRQREKIEALLLEASRSPVFGKGGASRMLSTLAYIVEDPCAVDAAPEIGMEKTLEFPEMAWMEEELLYARARHHYMKRDFPAALRDMDRVLARQPGWVGAAVFRPVILGAMGAVVEASGEDPEDLYRKALEESERIAGRFSSPRILENIGVMSMQLARILRRRGADPQSHLRRSEDVFSRSHERSPGDADALLNLAEVRREICEIDRSDRNRCRTLLLETVREIDRLAEASSPPVAVFEKRASLKATVARLFPSSHAERITLLKEADLDYRRVLESYEENPSAEVGRASVVVMLARFESQAPPERAGKLEEALEGLNGALDKRPGYSSARIVRGAVLLEMARAESLTEARRISLIDRAVGDIDAVLHATPRDQEAILAKAGAMRQKAQSAEAAVRFDLLESALAMLDGLVARTASPEALVERGKAHLAMATLPGASDPSGLLARAAADLEKALDAEPQSASVLVALAEVCKTGSNIAAVRGGDPMPDLAKAVGFMQKAVEHSPDHFGLRLNFGQLLLDAGMEVAVRGGDGIALFGTAVSQFDACLAILPGASSALNSRGRARMLTGQVEEALGRDGTRNYDAAILDFDAALESDPSFWMAASNKGTALTLTKLFDEAIESFRDAISRGGDPVALGRQITEAEREKEAGK